MDFGTLPPEVNSGRIYAGPGSGPMRAASAAWTRLAAELGSAARSYETIITELTDSAWSGPSSAAMVAAAEPYAAWMGATAGQAEQTAAQLAAAASAYDEAHAAVVPPPAIAANRSELAALTATNILGQNSAAIAAVDTQYLQMWMQDVAAMYGYAGRSAAAAAVPPFAEPPPTTNPAGAGGHAAQAAGAAAAGGAHTQLSQLLAAMPQAVQGLQGLGATAAPAAATLQSTTTPSLTQIVTYLELIAKNIVPFNDAIKTVLYGMVQYARNINITLDIAAAAKAAAAAAMPTNALTSASGLGIGAAGPPVSAGIGNAGLIGKLTVPPGWADTAPEAKIAAAALPGASPAAAPAGAPSVPAGIFTDAAMASLIGRSMTGAAPRARPAAVMNGHAHGRLEKLVTELAGTEEVQHWHVDPSRLDSLLEELAEKPGVHAVHVNDDGSGTSTGLAGPAGSGGPGELESPQQPG